METITVMQADSSEEVAVPGAFPAIAVLSSPVIAPITRVVSRGSGPVTIVLVPGTGCDERVFEPLLLVASDRYTFHCVVVPGFAGTVPPPAPEDETGTPWLDNAVRAVAQVVRERAWDNPIIVGHSMGGHLVFRALIEHPELFRAGVSIDGFPGVPLGPQSLSAAERLAMTGSTIRPRFIGMTPQKWAMRVDRVVAEVADRSRREVVRAMFLECESSVAGRYFAELVASDVTEDLRGLKRPLEVIASINDDLVGIGLDGGWLREMWCGLLRWAPNVVVDFLEHTPHMAIDARPEEIARLIGRFIDQVEDEGRASKDPPE